MTMASEECGGRGDIEESHDADFDPSVILGHPERLRRTTAAREITRYLNVYNAKIVAILCVLASILYHGFIHVYLGASSCHWLLSDGRFKGYNAWQPYGCMIHKYTKTESRNCMHYISYWGGKNHIVFLGDSRVRQLYFEFVNHIGKTPVRSYKAHTDLKFSDSQLNLDVEFLWSPIVNGSMLEIYKNMMQKPLEKRPRLLITGSATWSIKLFNASHSALANYTENLVDVSEFISQIHGNDTTEVIWMLQDPVLEGKLHVNRSMITNMQIDAYNRAALDKISGSGAQIWKSSRLVAQGYNADSSDGLHAGNVALSWDIQILLNRYCNNHMNFNDGTCCSSPEPLTTLQIVTGTLLAVSLVVYLLMLVCLRLPLLRKNHVAECPQREEGNHGNTAKGVTPGNAGPGNTSGGGGGEEGCSCSCCTENLYQFFSSLARLGIIMAFFVLCDRTNFFMKENKYYTHVNFFLPFLYLMILGLFFTENSKQSVILHRDQTDEWKGWMQLVVLIYHMTGASQMLHIYMQIRVLVTSYIFLSGYGHFCYFFTKGDFSFHRFCKVMFRFNFLVIVLCFVMNRSYQFYHFIPLVSFCFFLLYITLAIWPRITTASVETTPIHYLYLILKLVALGIAITLLYASEVFFEKIFLTNPIKALFVSSDDSVQDWRFHWAIDRYSTLFGVVFCFGVVIAKKRNFLDDSQNQTLFPRIVSWPVFFLSVCGLLGYAIFISFCRNKDECNEVHPYVSFVPIVSYIFMRNMFGWTRSKYSSFFAWFGRIALELFIAQYHIWLAADTHGVLVLVPNYAVVNMVVTSFVFVCVAHEIHVVTVVLADHLVPRDWRLLLRNLVCFVALILPVAITHGAFGG